MLYFAQTTFGDIVTATTGALVEVVPAADIALYVTAGTILALAARFGARIVKSMR